VLLVDGVNFDDAHGRANAEWPGAANPLVLATFENRFSPEVARRIVGQWAWFHLIDATALAPPDAQGRVTLGITTPFHYAQVLVEPSSARGNPFGDNWRRFQCGS
jgi:type VI protein secretion system component VasK